MPPLSPLLVCVCRSSVRWVQAWAVSGNTNMRAVFFFIRETDRHSSWFYKQSAIWLIRTWPYTNTHERSNKCMSIRLSLSVSPMGSHYNFSSLWNDSISFSYRAVINMLGIQEFRREWWWFFQAAVFTCLRCRPESSPITYQLSPSKHVALRWKSQVDASANLSLHNNASRFNAVMVASVVAMPT